VVLMVIMVALPVASGAVLELVSNDVRLESGRYSNGVRLSRAGARHLRRRTIRRGGPMGRRPTEVVNRAPLNRERTLQVALVIADDEGLDAVTMRRLAHELGVEAASLYHHVSGKNQILDGLVDAVAAQIEPPAPFTDWRTAITQRA